MTERRMERTNPELLEKIENGMREGTRDLSQPVILATWESQKEPVCIDGNPDADEDRCADVYDDDDEYDDGNED